MTMTETGPTRIGEATIAEFAAGLRGTAVRPGDADYDHERSIWNGAHDRHPALIARCAGVADVIRTVDLARSEGLPLAVRGGGHSIPGFSTVDDGIVLDLSLMKGIRVDPARRRGDGAGRLHLEGPGRRDPAVRACGDRWPGVLDRHRRLHHRRRHRLADAQARAGRDNLVGADVVTADGQFVHASADENPELFWGLRGGGGNFGVVTSFEFQLHEVGPMVLSGIVFYPAEEAEQVLRGYRAACAAAPDELTTLVNLTIAPPVPFLPESAHGKPIIAVDRLLVRRSRGRRGRHRTLPVIGHRHRRRVRGQPVRGVAAGARPAVARGACTTISARHSCAPPTTRHCACCWTRLRHCPTPMTEIHLHHLGGAVGRVPADATAFAMREQEFIVNVVARTPTAEGFADVVEWARGVTSALGPDAATYVNFTGEANAALVRASYPADTYRRLVELKNEYDPTNLFRLNQNIAPTV